MSVESPVLGGRYRLEGLIGRGGMASVWRATDTTLERPVAVKRLHARMHDDPELAERFRREGRAVGRLQHPNLVRLLDQGQEGDEPFLVFELVEGSDLKTLVRQDGRLPARDAASICAQVARALEAAHEAGVVHRDIKSHNVLVTPEGEAKLTDFGIARIVENEGANLTRTGIVMGSSDYLAPEQAEGQGVDRRSDIYSLGVVLFEALTGRLPFAADNPVAVATKHVYESPPDPRKLSSAIPRQLSQVCLRALAKRPGDRFQDAGAFADALEGRPAGRSAPDLEGGTTGRLAAVGPRPAPHKRRRAVALAVAAAAVAVVVAWGVGAFGGGGGGEDPGAPLRFDAEVLDPLPGGDGQENPATFGFINDGNPSTAWRTESYETEAFSGNKTGVGFRMQFDAPSTVRQVRITAPSAGANVRIFASDPAEGGAPLAESTLTAGTVVFPITTATPLRQLIVWITKLPKIREGQRYEYGADIGEVQVLGVANT